MRVTYRYTHNTSSFFMSRVRKPGDKFVNTTHYDDSVTNSSKKTRIYVEGEDYHKAKTLSHWLFVKYDMSYMTFRNKSKNRREELREEFTADTGIVVGKKKVDYEYEDAMGLIASIGVPFSPDGTPIGIGWDD